MDEARGVIEIGAKAPCKVISFDQTQREWVAAAKAELTAREAERPFTLPDNDRDMVRLWHKLDRRYLHYRAGHPHMVTEIPNAPILSDADLKIPAPIRQHAAKALAGVLPSVPLHRN